MSNRPLKEKSGDALYRMYEQAENDAELRLLEYELSIRKSKGASALLRAVREKIVLRKITSKLVLIGELLDGEIEQVELEENTLEELTSLINQMAADERQQQLIKIREMLIVAIEQGSITVRRAISSTESLLWLISDEIISTEVYNWLQDCRNEWENIFAEKRVTCLGDEGLATREHLGDFLSKLGVHMVELGPETDVLIVGKEGWEIEDFDYLIYARTGMQLKIYTQELLITWLLCGKDPFDNKPMLEVFRRLHPALQYLTTPNFEWPMTYVPDSIGGNFAATFYKTGLLAYLGYHVGYDGVGTIRRHRILNYVYLRPLPFVNDQLYMYKWGHPKTSKRLYQLAISIAMFTINAKRKRNSSMSQSISDWEADLAYLKARFYDTLGPYPGFRWPDTTITTSQEYEE